MKFAVLLLGAALAAQAQFVRRAPGFSLPDVRQKQHDLADYRGKVVLLDVMQTTCPKCLELAQILEGLRSKYGERIQVLSVVTMPDNINTVQKFIATNNIGYPVLFDCGQAIASYLNITPENPTLHFPHLFVIDKSGMIRKDFTAEDVSADAITAVVEAVLK